MAKLPNVPSSMGTPAETQGPANENHFDAIVKPEDRAGTARTALGSGPVLGANREYSPATYKTQDREVMTPAGLKIVPGRIREDR